LGIVTKDGNIIFPDRQMALFAQDVLSRVPGGTIVFDVKCSQRLGPAIKEAGGEPLMFKTGHSLIKAKMKEDVDATEILFSLYENLSPENQEMFLTRLESDADALLDFATISKVE
jgi:phosphomannomutase